MESPDHTDTRKPTSCLAVGCLVFVGSLIIIGVVGTAVVISINPMGQLERARVLANRHNIARIQKALAEYNQEHASYPPNLEHLGAYGITSDAIDEPKSNRPYRYSIHSGGTDYSICMPGTEPVAVCASKDSNPETLLPLPEP
jgi:type II secretory pathway pseudopilin PulG